MMHHPRRFTMKPLAPSQRRLHPSHPRRGLTASEVAIWVTMLVLCLAVIVAAFAWRQDFPDEPAVETAGIAAPTFTLTAHDGKPFSSDSLDGSIWVVDFIFTNCAGPCPLMTQRMALLQEKLADVEGVRFRL